MPELIQHLADLTGFRDRDQLDVTVVRAVNDVLHPSSLSIYRCVGEPGDEHWLSRARMCPGDTAPAADPPWIAFSALPGFNDAPQRRDSFTRDELITVGGGPQTNYFPISTEREVIGVLELETAAPLAPGDRTMVSTILRIYGNFHDLLDRSERDPLTGLLNRQTFDSALMTRAPKPLAENAPASTALPGRRAVTVTNVWLGVADIDHFKRVNDTYGHPIGDEVLLLMSRLLRSTFRHHDRLYRFGGEEFVVVLECATSDQAALAFERLRSNVERFSFPQVGHISVSVGFAQARAGDTPSATFSRADKALYHAKAHGRNQVASYDDLVRDGQILEAKQVVGDIELF